MAETRYLHLKLSSDLTADAKSNLEIIDSLGAATNVSSEGDLLLRSIEDIILQPQSADIGGGGENGKIIFGNENHSGLEIESFADSFLLHSGLSLKNQATTATNYVQLLFNDAANLATDQTVSLSFGSGTRTVDFSTDGEVVVVDATGKTLNIHEIGQLTTAVSIANGGTGQVTAALATKALLEGATSATYAANQNQILGINSAGTGLVWKTAGSGIVEAITTNAPISINNAVPAFPVISIPKATTSVDGYLSAADWTTFNNKADALPGGGTADKFLNGLTQWVTVNTDNVTELAGATNKWFTDARALSAAVGTGLAPGEPKAPSGGTVYTALLLREPAITAGSAGQYWTGTKTWQTLNTDVVPEGTAQYFTGQRVRDTVLIQSISAGDTTHSPSADAVAAYVGSSVAGGTFSTTWNPVSEPSKTITHNLHSTSVMVSIYNDSGIQVGIDEIDITGVDTVALSAVVDANLSATWTVVVQK